LAEYQMESHFGDDYISFTNPEYIKILRQHKGLESLHNNTQHLQLSYISLQTIAQNTLQELFKN